MTSKILAKLFSFAVQGNVRAAKLYLDAVGNIVQPATIIENQNNYIQINGLTITQELVEKLPPAQLAQLTATMEALALHS
jgi:hypothetical protein